MDITESLIATNIWWNTNSISDELVLKKKIIFTIFHTICLEYEICTI